MIGSAGPTENGLSGGISIIDLAGISPGFFDFVTLRSAVTMQFIEPQRREGRRETEPELEPPFGESVISILSYLCALCAFAVPTAWIRLRMTREGGAASSASNSRAEVSQP